MVLLPVFCWSLFCLAGVCTQVSWLLPRSSSRYARGDPEKRGYSVTVGRPVNQNAPSSTIRGFVLPLGLGAIPWTLHTRVLIVTTFQEGRNCLLHVRDGGTETQGGNLLEVTRWPAVGWDSNAKHPPPTLHHAPPWMARMVPLRNFTQSQM